MFRSSSKGHFLRVAPDKKDVRGHEKVRTYGHEKSAPVATRNPECMAIRCLTPASVSIHSRAPSAGHGGGTSQPPLRPKGLLHEISEGTNGHACRLPRGGLLPSSSRDLWHHRQNNQASRRESKVGRDEENGRRSRRPQLRPGDPSIIAERVAKTDGRILGQASLDRRPGRRLSGSPRQSAPGRAAEAKATWRIDHHRGRRPGVWAPGDMLVFDWGEIGPLFVFCAVLAWSRFRFVYFADNLRSRDDHGRTGRMHGDDCRSAQDTPHRPHGVSEGLKTVAGLVVPTPDYVRFVTHYGTRPYFCQGADPASKGIVENLVGYVKSDLMIPAGVGRRSWTWPVPTPRVWRGVPR